MPKTDVKNVNNNYNQVIVTGFGDPNKADVDDKEISWEDFNRDLLVRKSGHTFEISKKNRSAQVIDWFFLEKRTIFLQFLRIFTNYWSKNGKNRKNLALRAQFLYK